MSERSKLAALVAEYHDRYYQAEQSIARTMGMDAKPTDTQRGALIDSIVALEAVQHAAKVLAETPAPDPIGELLAKLEVDRLAADPLSEAHCVCILAESTIRRLTGREPR